MIVFALSALALSYQDIKYKEVNVIAVLVNSISTVCYLPYEVCIVSLVCLWLCCTYKEKVEYAYALPVLYNVLVLHQFITPLIVAMLSILIFRKKVPMIPTIMSSFI